MWVISVMPIGKAAAHKEFAYFSAVPHEEGATAQIPARGKEHFGLVLKCTPLKDIRADVRGAGFKLKKIKGASRRILSRQFLRAVFIVADWHASSVGSVLSALVPQAVLEKIESAPEQLFEKPAGKAAKPHAREYIVGSRIERIANYATRAEKTLAAGRSVLIITPTIVEAERIANALPTKHLTLLHGALTKKKLRETWTSIAEQPRIVVGTPLALSAPLSDIGALILERAGARGYERHERPFLHIPACAAMLAKTHSAVFIVGSSIPPISEEAEDIEEKPATLSPSVSLIDMRAKKDAHALASSRSRFDLFSPDARDLIERAQAEHEPVVLICARRGFASQTVCDDCGSALTCVQCGAALVLFDTGGARRYRCGYCGAEESAHSACRVCGGWRLTPLGVGLERVAARARQEWPGTTMFVADEKIVSHPQSAVRCAKEFAESRGALLAATPGILPYLDRVRYAVVVSVDSLLSLPEYTAPERALELLCELRGLTEHRVVVQTRQPDHAAVQAFVTDDTAEFIEHERQLRKRFGYPPDTVLIRLTLPNAKHGASAKDSKQALLARLAPYAPQAFSGNLGVKKQRGEHILIRLSPDLWPDRALLSFLRNLPPSFEIRVNPQSLFGY